MVGGDGTSMEHCKASLLVNIAHISKVSDLRELLPPMISARPVRALARLTRGFVPGKFRRPTSPRCGREPMPMPKIEVKRARASATISDREPHWVLDVDYGAFEVQIPLPAHYLQDDDFQTQRRQSVEAMESLAEALLRYADRIRKQWPHDWD
jgi:hypothetical protein